MYKVIDTILNIGCLLTATFYVLTVLWAQLNCSLIPMLGSPCHGSERDAWMVPLFLAPIGVPALIGLAVMLWGPRRG
ncbi:hypothetical protein BRAS3843_3040014 [Bradyrhizobium sp. STM 3843]|uniref:hypothetical protein n=1 Tax=Bradyrhizobium sp. STM 3843 TaxID=551947 RepID=UPI0002403FFC|nr:hypothetical protein [Bradyrhizobium sp. STM 3843]CCE09129.1 hypothetical protein BRAS3843_3040014 [Bradyrhizobium sp. STM 3843]